MRALRCMLVLAALLPVVASAAPPADAVSVAPLGMEFVPLAGGCFAMGSDTIRRPSVTVAADRIGVTVYLNEDETPRHQVCVAPFEMATTPVTEAQWQQLMGTPAAPHPNHPRRMVSWPEARAFAARATRAANDGYRYRLPTEAEWQYACAGGEEAPVSIDSIELETQARYWQTTPSDVGSFPPNAFGLYDLLGNVWEWTASDYQPYANAEHWNYQPNDDLKVEKVFRGGSYLSTPDFVSCTRRGHGWPDEPQRTIGFRLVRTPR